MSNTNLTVEKICRVDGFEFATEEQANAHIRREAAIEKLAALIAPALSALDDEETIKLDRHLVRRLQKRNHPTNYSRSFSLSERAPDATLLARAMANGPHCFREALNLIDELLGDLNPLELIHLCPTEQVES